jgi:hypothetical protein
MFVVTVLFGVNRLCVVCGDCAFCGEPAVCGDFAFCNEQACPAPGREAVPPQSPTASTSHGFVYAG